MGIFFANTFFIGAHTLFAKITGFAEVEIAENVVTPIEIPISHIVDKVSKEIDAPKNKGLLMFRGNISRSYYGEGSITQTPEIFWRYPKKPLCSESTVGNRTHVWCGNGWTGQPVVWDKENGNKEIIFGAFDKNVHFVDADTGQDTRDPFPTGDIIKGSVALDPDGFPLLYFGSRDNKLRIGALDKGNMVELWSLDAYEVKGLWNDDWDGNPLIHNDVLYEGGENGWFFAIKLNRHYDSEGKVAIDPKILFKMPSYDDGFLKLLGDSDVSIENSVAMYKDRVYFANSGGRILGLDVSQIEKGIAPVVFDYWTGDDTDASIVIDDDGMLYVASEEERYNERSREVGQLIKLDPSLSLDPLVWNIHIDKPKNSDGGIWATPALWQNYLFVPTNKGDLLKVDKNSGEIVWKDDIGFHAWSSPVISNDTLIVANCSGEVRGYDLKETNPNQIWKFNLESKSCIESTPALWDNTLYFGARDGYIYALK